MLKAKITLESFKSNWGRFTNREGLINAFSSSLNHNSVDNKILVFYGIGGIGKSSLLSELCNKLNSSYWATIIDFEIPANREPALALYSLRKSFQQQHGLKFLYFDIAYAVYWEKKNSHLPMTPNNFSLLGEPGNVVSEILAEFADIPYAGLIPRIDKWLASKKQKLLEKRAMEDLEILKLLPNLSIKEIEQLLICLWAKDLRSQMAENLFKVVIFFDTYEELIENNKGIKNSEQWIKELIINLKEVSWVICGKDRLNWEDDWNKYLDQHPLVELNPTHCDEYLDSCGIKTKDIKDIIKEKSEGLPFNLKLLVNTFHEIVTTCGREVTVDDFKIDYNVFEQFYEYIGDIELGTLEVLSVPNLLNNDIVQSLITQFQTAYPLTNYKKLFRFSFFTSKNGYWYMHKLMRQSLQNSLDQKDSLILVERFMFNYYSKQIDGLAPENVTADHLMSLNQAFYHGQKSLDIIELTTWFSIVGQVFLDAKLGKELLPIYRKVEDVIFEINITMAQNLEKIDTFYKQTKYF